MIRLGIMNDTILNPRQRKILELINNSEAISRREIKVGASVPTVSRDLKFLLEKGYIKAMGKGRATSYRGKNQNLFLKYFDIEEYFKVDPDNRVGVKTKFNFEIFSKLTNLFNAEEIKSLERINKVFSKQDILPSELERFVIELSWKSSKIEGNTYSLLDTETLIKEKIEASGHSKAEATMILNHKQAFDLILKNKRDFRKLSVSQITQLHNTLIKELDVTTGVRKHAVGVTGTAYKPIDNQWQIKETLAKLVNLANKTKFPLEKALIILAMISYIQPFADGNKRTARMLANAVLLAYDFYPLSYRSVDETDYKKALILFYEQNSLNELKKIIWEQYQFSLKTYF